jgi:hypothetical protein
MDLIDLVAAQPICQDAFVDNEVIGGNMIDDSLRNNRNIDHRHNFIRYCPKRKLAIVSFLHD